MATTTEKDKPADYEGEKTLTEDGKKIVEEGEVEGVNTEIAAIMAKHKPNPWGKGHLQLYALAAVCFLNSTMSGRNPCRIALGKDLICQRFRWIAYGFHQRLGKLYQLLQSPKQGNCQHRNRVFNLSNRSNVRCPLRLDCGLAR